MATRRPGLLLGGRYQLREPLDRGAFGEVWLAVDRAGGGEVAVKCLRSQPAKDEGARARFRREARLGMLLGGPHIVRALDAHTDEPPHFIVYERLRGETLAERLGREGDVALGEALAVGRGVLGALATAHARGVVHRDVKPANIFLADEGGDEPSVKLLDFGVAKDRSEGASPQALTADDATLGTLPYMAPEQATDPASVDERADLYALGAVLFHALAGRPPFAGRSAAALLTLKLSCDAPSLGEACGLRPPAALEALLARLLARDPAARPASAAEALAALGAVGAPGSGRAARSGPAQPVALARTLDEAPAPRTRRRP